MNVVVYSLRIPEYREALFFLDSYKPVSRERFSIKTEVALYKSGKLKMKFRIFGTFLPHLALCPRATIFNSR